jgi:CDP-diacylglycerol--serine O-phosphatidyltransferase
MAEADSSLVTLHSSLPYLLLAGVFISSYLLIAEIPMFALKFKQWGWKGNEIKYIFILTCVPILLLFGITGIAVIIAWYVILSVITKQSIQKPV